MHLDHLLDEYVVYLRAANRSENTVTSFQYHIQRFHSFLRQIGKDAAKIDPRLIRDYIVYLREAGYAATSIANNIRAIKTLFRFAQREGLLANDPSERISVPKIGAEDRETLEPDEITSLLRACNRRSLLGLRDFAIVLLLYDTGIRASELTHLRDANVDWERGLISVSGKGSKSRTLPLSGRTLRAVRRYVIRRDDEGSRYTDRLFHNNVGEPLTRSGLAQLLRRLGRRVGLHVHPHKLRHSFAVSALRNDASLVDIQDSLGHTTLTMTRHYARQSAVELARRHRDFSPANKLKIRV